MAFSLEPGGSSDAGEDVQKRLNPHLQTTDGHNNNSNNNNISFARSGGTIRLVVKR